MPDVEPKAGTAGSLNQLSGISAPEYEITGNGYTEPFPIDSKTLITAAAQGAFDGATATFQISHKRSPGEANDDDWHTAKDSNGDDIAFTNAGTGAVGFSALLGTPALWARFKTSGAGASSAFSAFIKAHA